VDADQFWALIEDARSRADDPADSDAVAAHATGLLSALPPEQIIAADRVMYSLTIASRLMPLWAAAYVINGGCSDDGFDYFRGWLIVQAGSDIGEYSLNSSVAGRRQTVPECGEYSERATASRPSTCAPTATRTRDLLLRRSSRQSL